MKVFQNITQILMPDADRGDGGHRDRAVLISFFFLTIERKGVSR